jgi:hypothetical protein
MELTCLIKYVMHILQFVLLAGDQWQCSFFPLVNMAGIST